LGLFSHLLKISSFTPISLKANANYDSKKGWNAIVGASKMGEETIVQLLVDNGAIVDKETRYGSTALMAAAEMGELPAVKVGRSE